MPVLEKNPGFVRNRRFRVLGLPACAHKERESRDSNSRRLRIIHLVYVRMYHKTRARTLTRAEYLVPVRDQNFLLDDTSAITIVSILKNSLES